MIRLKVQILKALPEICLTLVVPYLFPNSDSLKQKWLSPQNFQHIFKLVLQYDSIFALPAQKKKQTACYAAASSAVLCATGPANQPKPCSDSWIEDALNPVGPPCA